MTNKVVLYLVTRYMTYAVQFITSIWVAVKLGPFYLGIWGVILLLINYFKLINFGISNSLTVLLVQHKENKKQVDDYVKTALGLLSVLGFCIILFGIYYHLFGISYIDKYRLGNLLYVICFITILEHINNLFMVIYRVMNNLFYVAFYQSVVPLLLFCALFAATGWTLLMFLLGAYVLGNGLSIFFFVRGGLISWKGKFEFVYAKIILKKGLFLFIYNLCFYLIVVSTRTIVSIFYTVEEFGYFTFAFTLANSVLLLLEAFSFVILPKVIDRLTSADPLEIKQVIRKLRVNYISMAHGCIYLALLFFPVLSHFVPKYSSTLAGLQLMALAIMLNTNSFGYGSYLMAQNKEKIIAKMACISVIFNVVCALVAVIVFHIDYIYVIVSTMLAYWVYSSLCVFYAKKNLNEKPGLFKVLNEAFPLRLLIPYLCGIIIVVMNYQYLIFVPLMVFILLNIKTISEIYHTIKRILISPEIVNL